ncbi:hypothetical protein VE03_02100 [Pseudogymnoascus sp. 23342-1-I1]|nr:hypothetical protein VE03_02100 [Pseudogymnoascus sp. 23342-1-I1]
MSTPNLRAQYIPIANLEVRQASADTAAASPQPNCMSGGSIAGIVIGCIAGTLLLVWLWSSLRRNTSDDGYKHGAVATSSRPYDGRRRRRRHSSAGGRPVSRAYSTYETTERPAKVVYRN